MIEKLYTVEDIAKMTGLTGRTIRNYLADGRLRGRKIGSQWRFTESDITALFSAPEAVSSAAQAAGNNAVSEFLKPQSRSSVTICSVIDYPSPTADATAAMSKMISDTISSFIDGDSISFTYQYLDDVSVGRFTIVGPIDLVSKLVKLIRKKG